MRRTTGLALARALFIAALTLPLGLTAAGPAGVEAAAPPAPSIAIVGDAHGLRAVAEVDTGHGTRLATFQGTLGTIRMVGLPGSRLSIAVVPPDRTGHGSIRVGVGGGAPTSGKTGPSDPGPSTPGPSQAQSLADLGLRPALSTPQPSDGTPWASTCLDINVLGGAVQGSACNNVYKKHVNGGDWYLSNEYWASASLTELAGPAGAPPPGRRVRDHLAPRQHHLQRRADDHPVVRGMHAVDGHGKWHEQRDHDRRQRLGPDLPEHARPLEPAPWLDLPEFGRRLDGQRPGGGQLPGQRGRPAGPQPTGRARPTGMTTT